MGLDYKLIKLRQSANRLLPDVTVRSSFTQFSTNGTRYQKMKHIYLLEIMFQIMRDMVKMSSVTGQQPILPTFSVVQLLAINATFITTFLATFLRSIFPYSNNNHKTGYHSKICIVRSIYNTESAYIHFLCFDG